MTDMKIKKLKDWLLKEYEHLAFEHDDRSIGRREQIRYTIDAVYSLEEQGEDWEKAFREWMMSHEDGETVYAKDAWKAAMEWQEGQMRKDAVEAVVESRPNDYGMYMPEVCVPVSDRIHEGDKVRVIIIKEG